MNGVTRFFHELFNPHCEHCIDALRESRVCDTCEYLKMENARLHKENSILLDKLITKQGPKELKIEPKHEILHPISVGQINSWRVKRQLLENEDRNTARELAAQKRGEKVPTNELEDKLFDEELKKAEETNARP